ncbi:hypothetical protein KHA96_13510 [Bacillus sp. FJAT-49711]|uniref:hypothetical protein n=1 Tax=Bacillus sp. FJAT-49711 TaxID=2833585 RepID=UPI001BC9F44B|nr:hypothetical protein [Bacillus sp. FJAT-49711]MBS4219338.1 hypothetical protein [Bacillus sp. FJAT-49711]
MKLSKREIASVVVMINDIYEILNRKTNKDIESEKVLPVVAKVCIKLHPLYKDNSFFISLFKFVNELLLLKNETSQIDTTNQMNNKEKYKLLSLLEQFENSLIENAQFHIYFYNCTTKDIKIKLGLVRSIGEFTIYANLLDTMSSIKEEFQVFSVLIYSGQLSKQELANFDFSFQKGEIIESLDKLNNEYKNLDYYRHDRLYLEAKLESLKIRQDIQILLSGSSYTMCGLFEEHMPLPARNVAVDAQDLYYTLKTIRTALAYNRNIRYCIVSFAYYFWGYDLSLSTSMYQYKRITEVNYPIFKDKHNFPGNPDVEMNIISTSITPIKRRLFQYKSLEELLIEKVKLSYKDSRYYPYSRTESETLKHDEATNLEFAQKRATSHNKFFKYMNTVQENLKLFDDFAEEMEELGVKLILYTPPVTEYYRKSIDPKLISGFYSCMNPLKQKYNFKLIDLFQSDTFNNADFVDYDHLNDYGAKKLAEILVKELDF